jgi:hypothetical protein
MSAMLIIMEGIKTKGEKQKYAKQMEKICHRCPDN